MPVRVCPHCCTKIENLGVKLAGNTVLEKINLHLNCGEVLAVIGPNGAGKTTLLRAILKEIPYSGDIHFSVTGELRQHFRIGYVPQKLNFDLDSPISVEDFMATTLGKQPIWSGKSRKLKEKIKSALSKVASDHLMDRRLGELSGGELQRVLLCMAMTPPPELLLLDEPVSAVDIKGLSLFYKIVRDLRNDYDVSVIMVSHDIAGVAPYADRMVLLNRSILASGKPDEVLSDSKMIQTLGPNLWNISKLPNF